MKVPKITIQFVFVRRLPSRPGPSQGNWKDGNRGSRLPQRRRRVHPSLEHLKWAAFLGLEIHFRRQQHILRLEEVWASELTPASRLIHLRPLSDVLRRAQLLEQDPNKNTKAQRKPRSKIGFLKGLGSFEGLETSA